MKMTRKKTDRARCTIDHWRLGNWALTKGEAKLRRFSIDIDMVL
jgi:hypothetical protein